MLHSESEVKQLTGTVFQVLQPISDVIPLYLHVVRGSEAVAVMDGGLPSSAELLDRLIDETSDGRPVRYLCNSHPHHDHIGNFRRLREERGALVVATAEARAWIADPELNLDEFAFHHPHILGPTPALLDELNETFDGGSPVDIQVEQSLVLDLGGGVELEAFRVDGHLDAELAWFERSTRTLILGDVITATEWPIFHGHVAPKALEDSIRRLIAFVRERDVQLVALSHYEARTATEFIALAELVLQNLSDIRNAVLDSIRNDEHSLEEIWATVCTAFGKEPEFRALSMIESHLNELVANGTAKLTGPETYLLRR